MFQIRWWIATAGICAALAAPRIEAGEHDDGQVKPNEDIPTAPAAPSRLCLPRFLDDLRYFEHPGLAPLLQAVEAKQAELQKQLRAKLDSLKGSPNRLLAELVGTE